MLLHHISMIVSSQKTVDFYKRLGFEETERVNRGYDIIVRLQGVYQLELYVDATHPSRVDHPEAIGLRHLAFQVDDISHFITNLALEHEPIREQGDSVFTFVRDPDGQPIKLMAKKSI